MDTLREYLIPEIEADGDLGVNGQRGVYVRHCALPYAKPGLTGVPREAKLTICEEIDQELLFNCYLSAFLSEHRAYGLIVTR